MLDFFTALFLKVIDIIIKRADIKRNALGPLKMYEMYVSIREIIRNAKTIEKFLDEIIKETETHGFTEGLKGCVDHQIGTIFSAVHDQTKELKRFVSILLELMNLIEIFDRDVHQDLARVVDVKFFVLTRYYELFCRVDDLGVTIEEVDDIRKWLDFIEENGPYFFKNLDALEKSGVIDSRRFSFSNNQDLQELKNGVSASIKEIEKALFSFSDFIKKHCDLKDFFPKEIPLRSHRYDFFSSSKDDH